MQSDFTETVKAPQAPQRDTRRPGPRPQVRRQKSRWVRLIEAPHLDLAGEERPGMIELFVGNGEPVTRYLVGPEPHPEGLSAWAVLKLPGDETQPLGKPYHVVLDGDCGSTCECLGFLRYNGRPCRHISALQALRKAGRLA
jgi:hypothetical protein